MRRDSSSRRILKHPAAATAAAIAGEIPGGSVVKATGPKFLVFNLFYTTLIIPKGAGSVMEGIHRRSSQIRPNEARWRDLNLLSFAFMLEETPIVYVLSGLSCLEPLVGTGVISSF